MTHWEWKIKSIFKTYKEKKRLWMLNDHVWIRPLNVQDSDLVETLAKWRKNAQTWFPSQFEVTIEGTQKWFEQQVLLKEDRILFLIEGEDGKVGHIGFNRFDFENRSCEIDNVVRGTYYYKGIMTTALNWMTKFAKEMLEVSDLYLTTFEDNEKAIALYKRCNFRAIKTIPLRKVSENNEIKWVETNDVNSERYNLKMQYLPK